MQYIESDAGPNFGLEETATPPGWVISPLQFITLCQVVPNNSTTPIYTPKWRETLLESGVSPKNKLLYCPG